MLQDHSQFTKLFFSPQTPKMNFFKERLGGFLASTKTLETPSLFFGFIACQAWCSLVYRPLSHLLLSPPLRSVVCCQLHFPGEETEALSWECRVWGRDWV